MVITSLDNAKVAQVVKLADKKYRKQTGLYVIEGARLVADAVRHGAIITQIFVRESTAENFDFYNAIVVSDKVFAKMSDTVTSQGVVAVVQKQQNDLCAPSKDILILDGLQDPGNVGTLIRTAVACGFSDVFAVNSVDLYSPKVLRSAMSAHFCIKLHQCDDFASVLPLLSNVQILCADMDGNNVFCQQFDKQVALVVGNEGNGVSQVARNSAHKVVSLPMENDFESLNASVAGSVIMYQIYSNRH